MDYLDCKELKVRQGNLENVFRWKGYLTSEGKTCRCVIGSFI